MSRPRLVAVWCGAVAAAGVAVYAIVLLVGGGAPPPAPPGLPDTGRLPAWLGAIASVVALVLAIVTAGLGLTAGGLLGHVRPPMRVRAAMFAAAWVSCSLLQVILLTWELGDRADLFDTDRAKALLVQLAAALAVTLAWTLGRRALSAHLALGVTLIGLLPPVIAGHARAADHPVIAGFAVSAHVVGAALWIGGLAALGWLAVSGDEWRDALARYSRLAVVCVIVIAASGLLAGIPGLQRPADFLTSSYGAVMTLKIVLLVGLVAAGQMQRRYVIDRPPMRARAFVAIAGFELTTMVLTLALAAALDAHAAANLMFARLLG